MIYGDSFYEISLLDTACYVKYNIAIPLAVSRDFKGLQ